MLRKVKTILQKVFQSQKPTDRFEAIDAALQPSALVSQITPTKGNFDRDKTFFMLFSYKNGTPQNGLPIGSELLDTKKNPPVTTLGFKQIFWKVFQRVYTIPLNHEPITWLGLNLIIREAHVLVTKEGISAPNAPLDCLVVYSLESIDCIKDEVRTRIQTVRQAQNLTEQDLVVKFNQSIKGTQYQQLAELVFSGVPGYSFFSESYPEGIESMVPFFYGFYFYGWLICQRLEKAQVSIVLDLSQTNYNELLKIIAEHRIRLINLQRYFLSLNRSNLQSTKELANILRDHFSLQSRFSRHASINSSFEEHLDNISRISEAESSQIFKQIAAVLTFLGVPLAIFSALMSASTEVSIVTSPDKLWSNYKFLIIAILSFLIPSSLVFSGFLIELIFKASNLFRKNKIY